MISSPYSSSPSGSSIPITIYKQSATPSGQVGDLWFDTSTNTYMECVSTSPLTWQTMGGSGGGSVVSVALADGSTTPLYAISGSPVTSSGTLTFTLETQSANKLLAGPSSGSAAEPTFRSLVAADLPAQYFTTITTSTTLSATETAVLVNASTGSVTVTLPTAVGVNSSYYVKKIDSSANTVTIATSASQTIDNATSYVIRYQYNSATLKSDNSNWWLV